ncbi:hypothetical protein [Persephonella sp. KM09-Lau-8]|uniref:hypothetical protein n=1 Tax=Persephonella sp. KM09-Lau-8 TaxID=1158345 RepID=UPI0004975E43|nr:hypothetical protein [Persephonella sp. KM09-Lau-8]
MAKVYYLYKKDKDSLNWLYTFIRKKATEENATTYDLSKADISRENAEEILDKKDNSGEKIFLIIPLSNPLSTKVLELKRILNADATVFVFNDLETDDEKVMVALENADEIFKEPEVVEVEIKVNYRSSEGYTLRINKNRLIELYPSNSIEESLRKAFSDLGYLEELKSKGIAITISPIYESSSTNVEIKKIIEN